MSQLSLNLTARDFDAYAAEKATSNAFSRPRLEVKQRALTWARSVVARLGELGISVDVHASDEHPSLRNKKRVDCQWVFFWRDQAARDELDQLLDRGRTIADEIDDPSPYRRHAFLALRLDSSSVEVCFAVHPEAQVDVDNLRARLSDGEGALAAELIQALKALPEEFTLGVDPSDRKATSAATPEAIREMVERAAAGQVPLWIGWSVSRDVATTHSEILDDQLEDAIIALAPIYRLVAWSRENDRITLDRRIETVAQERARAHIEAEAQTEKWRAEQASAQAEARRRSLEQAKARAEEAARRPVPLPRPAFPKPVQDNPKKPTLDTLFGKPGRTEGPNREAVPKAPSKPAVSATMGLHAVPAASQASSAPRVESDRTLPSNHEEERHAPLPFPATPAVLEKGAKVRVLSGPFADKVGVLGELDGRGGARVLLGLLSTRLELAQLEALAEGRERPPLHSSHRKPLSPSPRKAR